MPARKVRKTSSKSEGESECQLSKEQRDRKRKRLFMQQFEKEAQEVIDEMEAKLEHYLATVDRVFTVELMKMPPTFQRTLMKDLMCDEDTPAGEVTIAIKKESTEISQPLTRKSSKKGNLSKLFKEHSCDSTKNARSWTASSGQENGRVQRLRKGSTAPSLITSSVSYKTPRVARTLSTKRTRGRAAKLSDSTAVGGVPTRVSTDDTTSLSPIAMATISTSGGETLFLSEDVKDNIDIRTLDDTALLQIYRLRELMDYMCKKIEKCNL